MTTATEHINKAYTFLGYKDAREALDGQDAAFGLSVLNNMVDSWNTQGLFIYATTELVVTASGQALTIGPGQTFNTARPIRMPVGSFARISTLDYGISWIDEEQYNSILLKDTASTIPIFGYYDGGNPTGTLRFWPYQNTATEYHIVVETQLTEFATLATNVDLPQGYARAIELSLAEELAPGLREPTPALMRNAMNARRAIRLANAKVPTLRFAETGTTPIARFLAGV